MIRRKISQLTEILEANQVDELPIISNGVSTKIKKQNLLKEYQETSEKGESDGYAPLDENAKVPLENLPSISISETFVASSEEAMLDLEAQKGDVSVRSDINKSYILAGDEPTVLVNWQELLTPTDQVQSVDGQSGDVNLENKYLQLGETEEIDLESIDEVNGTKRIKLTSYERAVNPTHYGEVIRMQWMKEDAKVMLAWKDMNGLSKAWVGAHDYLLYIGDGNPGNIRHRHFSIEVSDAAGLLQTRLEIPFDLDRTNIKTASADFTVDDGLFRISRENGANKDIAFSIHPDDDTKKRWAIRVDSTTESGSDVGSDFKIVRYSDLGVALDSPFFIKRSNGRIGIANNAPKSTVDIGGSIGVKVTTRTESSYNAGHEGVILGNAVNNSITVNLPEASTVTNRIYTIKKIDSSVNAVIVDAYSSETIDGVLTKELSFQYDFYKIVSDGSNWHIIG